jgi:aldose 1-epimerase
LQELGKAVTTLSNPATDTHLEVWQQCTNQTYNYLQIYTPADRKTIAIEPMTCAADSLNNGLGLWIVAPKSACKAKYGVRMKRNEGHNLIF